MTDRWTPPGPALLFAPADRPERFTKAAERSDAVILDLEDGCRAENRASARENIVAADLDPARTVVRINPPGTPDFDADLQAVADSPFTTVMLPKAEGGRSVDALSDAHPDASTWRIIALVETPRGVLDLASLAAHPQVDALFWGAEDLTAALGGTSSRYAADETPPAVSPAPWRSIRDSSRSSGRPTTLMPTASTGPAGSSPVPPRTPAPSPSTAR
jgi:citrate lyase subunit beta/citryl-CoA lyase